MLSFISERAALRRCSGTIEAANALFAPIPDEIQNGSERRRARASSGRKRFAMRHDHATVSPEIGVSETRLAKCRTGNK